MLYQVESWLGKSPFTLCEFRQSEICSSRVKNSHSWLSPHFFCYECVLQLTRNEEWLLELRKSCPFEQSRRLIFQNTAYQFQNG